MRTYDFIVVDFAIANVVLRHHDLNFEGQLFQTLISPNGEN